MKELQELDINHKNKSWLRIRDVEFNEGIICGLSKHNSNIAIRQLKDFENGLNTSTKGVREPASLMRIRQTYKILSKLCGSKEKLDEISQEKLSKIVKNMASEHFARNVKVIYSYMKRVGIRKDNPADHILAKDFSKGKPAWVYLGEDKMKLLINFLSTRFKVITTFLYDSGIRPEEAWKIRVFDFQEDFTILDIPEKRKNGERVIKKNSFGRKIKLKLSSELVKEYVKQNNLNPEDPLINITQAGFNKGLRVACVKLFGTDMTKARETYDKITAYDLRHNSACYWLKRYKTNKDLMYRFGWKSEDKVFYYTEFLDMRDTIDDEDMLTKEDKTKLEKEVEALKKQLLENQMRYEQSLKEFQKQVLLELKKKSG